MRTHKTFVPIILGGLLWLFSACASVQKAPAGAVPSRRQLESEAFGAWCELVLTDSTRHKGELISVDSTHIMVLDTAVSDIPLKNISKVKLILFKNAGPSFALLTSIGTVSCLTQGYYGVPMIVLWLSSGIPVTIAEYKRVNWVLMRADELSKLRPYSRFPQGIPDNVNPLDLKSRRKIKKEPRKKRR